MKARAEKLKRIGALQTKLHDLKRARVAAIDRERTALGDEIGAVFEALASGALAYGAQARFGARYALKLKGQIDALALEQEEARGAARTLAMRAKLAEQAAGTALAQIRDQKERKELVDLIDRALARRRASPT